MALGKTLGKAIKADTNTKFSTRGRFAIVCVEVDLSKPLIPKIFFEGRWLSVEYEGLKLICFRCGRAGKEALTIELHKGLLMKEFKKKDFSQWINSFILRH